MPIRNGVKSPWGTVVAPGVLAVNHQHLSCMRVDPALDGHNNAVLYEDCVPVRDEPELDPFGCAFRVHKNVVQNSRGYDLDLIKSRTFKIIDPSKINNVSGQPIGYKLHAVPSQMMMMSLHAFNQKRGIFTSKPIWVTKYRDHQLWAAGEFTNQSREDSGLAKWTADAEHFNDGDGVVLWHAFGVTHVTRPEDFPVMPAEKTMVSLKPSSFFEQNPSNDVPRSDQRINASTLHEELLSDPCCSKMTSLKL